MELRARERGQKNGLDPNRELVVAILRGAYKDLFAQGERHQENARWFFSSGIYRFWCELIDVDAEVAFAAYERIMADDSLISYKSKPPSATSGYSAPDAALRDANLPELRAAGDPEERMVVSARRLSGESRHSGGRQ